MPSIFVVWNSSLVILPEGNHIYSVSGFIRPPGKPWIFLSWKHLEGPGMFSVKSWERELVSKILKELCVILKKKLPHFSVKVFSRILNTPGKKKKYPGKSCFTVSEPWYMYMQKKIEVKQNRERRGNIKRQIDRVKKRDCFQNLTGYEEE